MQSVAVIPARFASTRFPGKPLVFLLGKPLITWVVEAARRAPGIEAVVVATDHGDVADVARGAGARVVMTSAECASGTDRVAEVARSVEARVYVNLQGDEPLIDPEDVGALAALLAGDDSPPMATLSRPVELTDDFTNPDVVKVVCDGRGDALYFSRAPIPHHRDGTIEGGDPPAAPRKHLGIYAYTRDALLAFTALPPGRLERTERLEQLRALEAGWKIRVLPARTDSIGVDRPGDVARVEAELKRRGLVVESRNG